MPKLHLPHPVLPGTPLCERQLNNHREARSQQHDGAQIVAPPAFTAALLAAEAGTKGPGFCKHCARKAGLLPALSRKATPAVIEDEEAEGLEDSDENDA